MSDTLDDWLNEPEHSDRTVTASAGRSFDDAFTAAVERGAVSPERESYWRSEDNAAFWLDQLQGTRDRTVRAGGLQYVRDLYAKPTRHFQTEPVVPPGKDRNMYVANPLVEQARKYHPATVAAARAEAPEPRLFGDSDLPLATASGIDPSVLLKLPWSLRRVAAAAPTPEEFYRISEFRNDALKVAEFERDESNAAYKNDVSEWLAGSGTDQATGRTLAAASKPDEYSLSALHAELFGDHRFEQGEE